MDALRPLLRAFNTAIDKGACIGGDGICPARAFYANARSFAFDMLISLDLIVEKFAIDDQALHRPDPDAPSPAGAGGPGSLISTARLVRDQRARLLAVPAKLHVLRPI